MPPSEIPGVTFTLTAQAQDECTRIEILDGNQRPLPLGETMGEVTAQVPAGVYAVRFHQGRQYTEKLAVLSPASPHARVDLGDTEAPWFASAAPVFRTATSHEWQSEWARSLSRSEPAPAPPPHAGPARLFLFLRNPFAELGKPGPDLDVGVTVCAPDGKEIFNLAADGHHDPPRHWVGAHLALAPGPYRLRRTSARQERVEHILPVQESWQTQVFLMTGSPERERLSVVRTSIMMARPDVGFEGDRPDLRWTETALRALQTRGNIPGTVRTGMLWAKFENPMLGLYAGLLHLRRERMDEGLMREVFLNLLALVGPLPDVVALGWAIAQRRTALRADTGFMNKLRGAGPCPVPPLLRESWDHLLRASADESGLVPSGSLADGIGGRIIASSPWLAWRADSLLETPMPALEEASIERPTAPRDLTATPAPAQPGAEITQAEPAPPEPPLSRVLAGLLESAALFTLQAGLPKLAGLLRQHPESRSWLQSPRFSDLERRVAYWLQPAFDPRLAAARTHEPALVRALARAAKERLADPSSLLTDLGISSTTAVRAGWGLFTKLFVLPVLPNPSRIRGFITRESHGNAAVASCLRSLARRPSPLHHPASGRRISLLEIVYLAQRGSPAERAHRRRDPAHLATLLREEGFVSGPNAEAITPARVAPQLDQARRVLVRALRRIERLGSVAFDAGWEEHVLPSPDSPASPATLIPVPVAPAPRPAAPPASRTRSKAPSGPRRRRRPKPAT